MTKPHKISIPMAELSGIPTLIPLPAAGGIPQTAIVFLLAGEPKAYLNRCRHHPIPLDSGSGEVMSQDRIHLMCHTHGALYRREDGYCTEGPCEGLSLLSLRIVRTATGWELEVPAL
ncbi:MAG: Rieske 2Fe-2S domain-containing protein [Myxococcota bacterium]